MDLPNREECKYIAAYFLNESAALDAKKREAFLALYRDLTCVRHVNGVAFPVRIPKFRVHEHVCDLSSILKDHTSTARQICLTNIFQDNEIPKDMRQSAIQILVQLNFMLNCEPSGHYLPGSRVENWYPTRWQDNESLQDFFLRTMPRASEPQTFFDNKKHKLKAWKLSSRHNIQLVPTDDLAEHLLFDPRGRPHGPKLRVFRHTTWLLSQLERRTESNGETDLGEDMKDGCLPRQLMIETLETIYSILFPLINESSRKSLKLLKSLARNSGFDLSSVENGSRAPQPEDFEYYYWGNRLNQILEHVQKPAGPSSRLMAWLQRRATERVALWIAILGLFLSAFFGLLSCLIGIAQLWVSILAWKYAVTE